MNQYASIPQELPAWQRTSTDELLNAVTHGFGFLLSVAGAFAMTSSVLAHGSPRIIFGCEVYLATLVAVYLMSTLSHTATSVRWKSMFRKLDQAFIYLLIVGSYTPISLAYLRGGGWLALLAVMWMVALIGFGTKVIFAHRVEAVAVAPYVLLGWLAVVSVPTLWHTAPIGALEAMIAGGLCYTAGTLFLIYDERVRHFHVAWHLFVIAGSICHFLAIYVFVVHVRN